MTILRANNAWKDFVCRRRRLRVLTRKIFYRLSNAGLMAGWSTWTAVVEVMKKEEFVISIFVKRWRNIQLFKLFQAWWSVIEENRWAEDDDDEDIATDLAQSETGGGDEGTFSGGTRRRFNSAVSSRSEKSTRPVHVMVASGNGMDVTHKITKHRAMAGTLSWDGDNSDAGSVKSGVSLLVRDMETRANFGIGARGGQGSEGEGKDGRGWGKPVQGIIEMAPEQVEQLEVAKFNAKKALDRARFYEVEKGMRADRALFNKRILNVVGNLSYINSNIFTLVRSIFRNRGFGETEKAFKCWAIGAALYRRERGIGAETIVKAVKRAATKVS